MALQQIDAKMLSKMFLAGAKNLEEQERMDQRVKRIPRTLTEIPVPI